LPQESTPQHYKGLDRTEVEIPPEEGEHLRLPYQSEGKDGSLVCSKTALAVAPQTVVSEKLKVSNDVEELSTEVVSSENSSSSTPVDELKNDGEGLCTPLQQSEETVAVEQTLSHETPLPSAVEEFGSRESPLPLAHPEQPVATKGGDLCVSGHIVRLNLKISSQSPNEAHLMSSPRCPTYVPSVSLTPPISTYQKILHQLKEEYLTPNQLDGKYVEDRDYKKGDEVGRGGEGVCCRAVDVKKGTLFVIKGNKDCYMSSKLYSECKILSELHHRHVVVFLGAVEEVVDGTVKMFMEFAPCGTIQRVFWEQPLFQVDPILIVHLLQQVLQGVNYLHQKYILHKDIKGENVLLFEDWICKLTDFGLAVHADNISIDNCVKGTCPFVSPEYVRTQHYRFSSDVWSTMAVGVEMMTGELPWHGHKASLLLKIGQYRAEKDFHDLVPEQAHKERLQELHLLDDMDVSECYHSLLAMMRAVFHENEIERPSAYELLHWDVMLKAPHLYQ
jgi:hypothetical protein